MGKCNEGFEITIISHSKIIQGKKDVSE